MQTSWFIRRQPRPAVGKRLLCFPYAGAGASVFRDWDGAVPADVEVLAVQLPGRETRLRERPVDDVAEVVAHLVRDIEPYLDCPVVFFGHSMGGLVAFELARALIRAGLPAPAGLIVSARRAPRLPHVDAPLHSLDDTSFVAEIQRRYGGIPEAVLEHRDLLELLLPALRADIHALETWQYTPATPLDCPILALGGAEDRRVTAADLDAWAAETRGAFSRHVVPGGHFFLQSARPQVLSLVASVLSPLRPLAAAS
ncbi:N/A [soil metagenome]